MFDLKLFLGFRADDGFQMELQKANQSLVALFVGKPDYLQEVNFQGKQYLGKYLAGFPSVEEIADLEKHLLSLLQKLAPKYPFNTNPPILVTLNAA